jgi:hypothetical protein
MLPVRTGMIESVPSSITLQTRIEPREIASSGGTLAGPMSRTSWCGSNASPVTEADDATIKRLERNVSGSGEGEKSEDAAAWVLKRSGTGPQHPA